VIFIDSISLKVAKENDLTSKNCPKFDAKHPKID